VSNIFLEKKDKNVWLRHNYAHAPAARIPQLIDLQMRWLDTLRRNPTRHF